MLSFFVELFFDISGSDRCVQFLFLGAKLHRFPHRRTIFTLFRSQNTKILTRVKHLIYIKMPLQDTT